MSHDYLYSPIVLLICFGLICVKLFILQDMSLLDSLPVDRNFIRESLDDVNIDVWDEEVAMQVTDFLHTHTHASNRVAWTIKHFPFPFPSFLVTGWTLTSKCFTSLSKKNTMHAL